MLPIIAIGSWRAFVLLDLKHDKKAVVKTGRCWGVTWNESNLFVAEWKGKYAVINVFDKKLRLIAVAEPPKEMPLTAPHQIYWFDGWLWITNTQYDYIQKWNGDFENPSWEIWRPLGLLDCYNPSTGRGNNKVHMNSIWYDNASKCICLVCHNNKKNSFMQQYHYPGLKLKDQLDNIGRESHNIWRENGNLITCSSSDGRVQHLSGHIVKKTGGYPRGVVFSPHYRIVGVSANIPFGRRDRESTDGFLHIYEGSWENIIIRLPLFGLGQIYDIRALMSQDRTHYSGSEKVEFDLRGYGL